MAERLNNRVAVYGQYQAYPFSATQVDAAVDTGATHGMFLGYLVVGSAGTSITIKIGNGTTNTASNVIFTIQPQAGVGFYPLLCPCDKGAYIAISGTTAGNYTLLAQPMAI